MHSGRRNGPKQGAKRPLVGINAHLLSGEAGYRRAGIHQYIAQVLRHLPWEEETGPAYLVFTRQTNEFTDLPGVTAVPSRWPTENRLVRIAWEQIVWPWLARRHGLDLLHSMAFVLPRLASTPAVVTVYDLSFVHFPERFPRTQRWYLTRQTEHACRRARRIITISESGRRDVHRFFGIPPDRIDVVVPGVEAAYRVLPEAVVADFRRRQEIGRFILHVGTLQPRKNIPVLIDAFARLNQPDLKLVLIGGKGWLFDDIFARVRRHNLADRVLFTGYVPDEELPLWYNAADLLVFPSLYEGFGMPVVEAMACGTPVVAANSSSISEAVGEAGLLFEPENVSELRERMTAVLNNRSLRAKMRAQGLTHAQQFSWERAGRETAAVYRRALD